MSSFRRSIFTPSRANMSGMMPKLSNDTFLMVNSLPVMAAMPMKLPTSIMSGSTVCSVPCRLSTPSIVRRLEAMPEIFAPIRLSILQSCWI